MLSALVSGYIVIVEIIFGILAILTQRASLRSKDEHAIIVHGLVWSAEVLIAVSSFFILAIFSTELFATIAFIIGLALVIGGSIALYTHISNT